MLRNKSQERLIAHLIRIDPGLPRPLPTESYWQKDPHELAEHQTHTLPHTVDIVVIGSGVTGAAVSKTLLERDKTVSVLVLEARQLCSGATGRNGGQLATNAGESYASLATTFGQQSAGNIVRFTLRNLAKMRQLVEQYDAEYCHLQDTTKVRTFLDRELFEDVRASIRMLEADHPDLSGIYQVVSGDQLSGYGIYEGVGALLHKAGSVWPYRFITKVFEDLLQRYSPRFSLETNTPVTTITHEEHQSHPYIIQTPRGTLRCAKVIHCTNGHAAHLLPGLGGRVFPVCGSMTVQNLGSQVPNQGSSYSWAFHSIPKEDPETGTISDGLMYLIQSATSGLFFFGGDNAKWEEMLHADDTKIAKSSLTSLQRSLRTFCTNSLSTHIPKDQLVAGWSGIMGFSSDGLPLVGQVPHSLSNRAGVNEWAAIAFNGYGMANCWLAAEALVCLMLGEPRPHWLPEPYMITAERIERSLSVEKSVELLLGCALEDTGSKL